MKHKKSIEMKFFLLLNFGMPPTSLKFYAILIILEINVITIITIIIIIKKIPSFFFIIEMPYLNVYDILVIITIRPEC